jgi:transitional endoplasmic reticulum ATPase
MPIAKDVAIDELVKRTEGYVGADIEAVCREAAMLALRSNIEAKHITLDNFEGALKKVRPSASKEIQQAYAELQEKFSSARANQMKEDKPAYYG